MSRCGRLTSPAREPAHGQGQLSAVIDFATLRAADPAGDLLAAWYAFTGESRRVFRNELGVDDDTWARGRGWAPSLQMIAIPYYRKRNPDAVRGPSRVIADTLADFAAEGEDPDTGHRDWNTSSGGADGGGRRPHGWEVT
ncbi:hypothetical protein [Streptomyces sp. NPDC056987]|uniref:hypothetical protein n=1 Tax=Streptomyces sp. NPDC056987 TaxID=3345988 RepID=UPI00362F10FD